MRQNEYKQQLLMHEEKSVPELRLVIEFNLFEQLPKEWLQYILKFIDPKTFVNLVWINRSGLQWINLLEPSQKRVFCESLIYYTATRIEKNFHHQMFTTSLIPSALSLFGLITTGIFASTGNYPKSTMETLAGSLAGIYGPSATILLLSMCEKLSKCCTKKPLTRILNWSGAIYFFDKPKLRYINVIKNLCAAQGIDPDACYKKQ